MSSFDIFKVRVERPEQATLEGLEDMSPPQLVERAVSECPWASLRGETEWHVGNFRRLDDTGVYFRLGKARVGMQPVLDDTGNFLDVERTMAPYTHCVMDIYIQACAIMKKSELLGYTQDLAVRLESTLNNSHISRSSGVEFLLLPINDTEEFADLVRRAHKVSMFSMTFRQPNPWDGTETREAFERWIETLEAEEGRATARGEDLNREAVIENANTTSAAGDDASAAIQSEADQAIVRRYIRGNIASFSLDDFEESQAHEALRLLRHVYRRIRGQV